MKCFFSSYKSFCTCIDLYSDISKGNNHKHTHK